MGILRSSLVLRTLATFVGLVALGGCYGRGGDTCRQNDDCRKGYVCCATEGGGEVNDPSKRGACHASCAATTIPADASEEDAASSDASTDADMGDASTSDAGDGG